MDISNIKKKCKEKKTTIRAVEREVGFSDGAISAWRLCSPSVGSVAKVASFLECTVDDLLVKDG